MTGLFFVGEGEEGKREKKEKEKALVVRLFRGFFVNAWAGVFL